MYITMLSVYIVFTLYDFLILFDVFVVSNFIMLVNIVQAVLFNNKFCRISLIIKFYFFPHTFRIWFLYDHPTSQRPSRKRFWWLYTTGLGFNYNCSFNTATFFKFCGRSPSFVIRSEVPLCVCPLHAQLACSDYWIKSRGWLENRGERVVRLHFRGDEERGRGRACTLPGDAGGGERKNPSYLAPPLPATHTGEKNRCNSKRDSENFPFQDRQCDRVWEMTAGFDYVIIVTLRISTKMNFRLTVNKKSLGLPPVVAWGVAKHGPLPVSLLFVPELVAGHV